MRVRRVAPGVTLCAGLLASALVATPASADFIMNEFSGDQFGDSYSALFTIHDTADPDVFLATLTNTSPDDGFGLEPLISALVFNTTAIFGVDFTIQDVSPAWSVVAGDIPGPPNTAFDVVLRRVAPADRLGFGESLTFSIVALIPGAINFDTFLDAEIDSGAGIGGGGDFGQKAVRFQRLGERGRDSDLLADNWDPPTVIHENPEPSTLVLLGSGLLGIASVLRRRKQR